MTGARAAVAGALVRLWALPVSALATPFVLLALAGGGRIRLKRGVLELDGGWLPEILRAIRPGLGIQAMTLGHVVLARDAAAQRQNRRHEREHVRQCERWGPLFPPAYLLASVIARARGRDAYADNAFEVAARRAAGESD